MACSLRAFGLKCRPTRNQRTYRVLCRLLVVAFLTNCFTTISGVTSSTASAQSLTHSLTHSLAGSLAKAAPLATTASSLAAVTASDKGSSSRLIRKQTVTAIPWNNLSEEQSTLVKHVVSKPTLYRHMPTRIIDCDPELFALLLEHPELVVDSWGIMGMSKLQLEKVGPQLYKMTDNTGTVGQVQILHADAPVDSSNANGQVSRMLILAQGVYDAPPMPRPIKANCVMLLTSIATTEANGRTYIRTELDSFIRIERSAAELILKAINPLVSKTADHNFVETMRFVSLFSRTAEQNPDGMERLATHFTKVEEPVRDEFVTVCHATARRSAERQQRYTRLTPTPASTPANDRNAVRPVTANQPVATRYR